MLYVCKLIQFIVDWLNWLFTAVIMWISVWQNVFPMSCFYPIIFSFLCISHSYTQVVTELRLPECVPSSVRWGERLVIKLSTHLRPLPLWHGPEINSELWRRQQSCEEKQGGGGVGGGLLGLPINTWKSVTWCVTNEAFRPISCPHGSASQCDVISVPI